MTTEKPMDKLPKLPTAMATEESNNNALKPNNDSLQMKRKPNRITCRITEISIKIPNHEKSTEVHTSTEPRWQSTIDIYISRRRSIELSKGG